MNYDRIILQMLDRISELEDEVEILKNNKLKSNDTEENNKGELICKVPTNTGRDTTKYLLDGKKYGKNRLVLAIVKKYMNEHPNISAEELMSVFDKSLQGSLGVVRRVDDVKVSCADYKRRFFSSENDVIKTSTSVCVVCTQWGIGNISNIITRAKQLGINVEILK